MVSPWRGLIEAMVDALAVKDILSIEGAAWTGLAIFALFVVRMWNGAPAMFEQWIAWRRARAEHKAAEWGRLLNENKRIDERCIRLEAAEERCRSELIEVKERLASLEGYMAGQGRASQEAAGIVAIERLGRDGEKPV